MAFNVTVDRGEYFVSGQFQDLSTGIYIPFAKWLNSAEVDAYLANPACIDDIVDQYKATAINAQIPRELGPNVVTMRQARLAMFQAGILTSVDAAIAGMEGDEGEKARIEWQYAQTIDRDHPLVTSLSSVLSISESQMNELFATAQQL